MLSQWISGELSTVWAFVLSLANGVVGLPPSELLSFKAAQMDTLGRMILLFGVLVSGSIISGLLMFCFGRSLQAYPRAVQFASYATKYKEWPEITPKEFFRVVLIGRMTPGLRSQVPIFAGFIGGRFSIFLWAHMLASGVWYGFWISLSKIFLTITSQNEYQVIYVLGLLIISVVVIHTIWHFLPLLRTIFKIIRSPKS